MVFAFDGDGCWGKVAEYGLGVGAPFAFGGGDCWGKVAEYGLWPKPLFGVGGPRGNPGE